MRARRRATPASVIEAASVTGVLRSGREASSPAMLYTKYGYAFERPGVAAVMNLADLLLQHPFAAGDDLLHDLHRSVTAGDARARAQQIALGCATRASRRTSRSRSASRTGSRPSSRCSV